MHFVIMAGGSGTRFWPLSRKGRPKQFLNIVGKSPMIYETYERIAPLSVGKGVLIVGSEMHSSLLEEIFKGKSIHIIKEPIGRNTAPCIALASLYAKIRGWDEPIAFLPADHFIEHRDRFLKALKIAEEVALKDSIVTLGIMPNRPETGYGYIRIGDGKGDIIEGRVYSVDSFVEKPDIERAEEFIRTKRYLWNAGIFVIRAEVVLDEIRSHLPDLFQGMVEIEDYIKRDRLEEGLKRIWPELPSISFDYGVMEKTQRDIFVIPTDCGWTDVGSWLSVYELKRDRWDNEQNLIEAEAELIDCKRCFISSTESKIITCIGVEDILVVNTHDALLICRLSRSQDIRKAVELFQKRGKEEIL